MVIESGGATMLARIGIMRAINIKKREVNGGLADSLWSRSIVAMAGDSISRRDVLHLCALGALAAYFMVWPVWRAQFPIEIWFTESWNAYHQDAAAAGFRLYPKADEFVVNNYPPLSFFAIGALGKVFGDNLFVGRVVSVIGLLAIAAEIALVVRLLTGALLGGILGALWFVAIMAHNFTFYVGANDPQIAGLAIMGAALVWFLQRDLDGKAPEPALLLMVVAGFWKHNIIGIPLTAVTFLILRDWRSAIRPVLLSAAAAGAGLLLCSVIFGNVFIENLLTPRDYRLSNLHRSDRTSAVGGACTCDLGNLGR